MIWTILKALFVLIPFIVDAVKEGKIKTAAFDEVFEALEERFYQRIHDAIDAKRKEMVDENTDPNNRSR
jgi:hypothetical protein